MDHPEKRLEYNTRAVYDTCAVYDECFFTTLFHNTTLCNDAIGIIRAYHVSPVLGLIDTDSVWMEARWGIHRAIHRRAAVHMINRILCILIEKMWSGTTEQFNVSTRAEGVATHNALAVVELLSVDQLIRFMSSLPFRITERNSINKYITISVDRTASKLFRQLNPGTVVRCIPDWTMAVTRTLEELIGTLLHHIVVYCCHYRSNAYKIDSVMPWYCPAIGCDKGVSMMTDFDLYDQDIAARIGACVSRETGDECIVTSSVIGWKTTVAFICMGDGARLKIEELLAPRECFIGFDQR